MDAHQPVTLKEGDRYPLRPPYKNTLSNLECGHRTSKGVVAVLVCFYMARSYNGHYLGLSIRRREFDSPTSRQAFAPVMELVYVSDSKSEFCGFESRWGHQVLQYWLGRGPVLRILDSRSGSTPLAAPSFA